MILPFVALALIIAAYFLLVRGFLWKIILGVGGWFGIYIFLGAYIPSTNARVFVDSGVDWISWSMIVPTLILMLAMAHTKAE